MSAVMLNTLEMVKELEAAGVPEKQVEAQVTMFWKLSEKGFATKSDIKDLKTDVNDVKSDIKDLKTDVNDVKSDIKGLKTDVNDVKSDIKGLKTDVNDVKTAIKELKTEVGTIETRLVLRLGGLMVVLMTAGFAFLALVLKH